METVFVTQNTAPEETASISTGVEKMSPLLTTTGCSEVLESGCGEEHRQHRCSFLLKGGTHRLGSESSSGPGR